MASLKLFVKGGSGRCPAAREVAWKLRSEGFEVHEYDLDTAEGLAEGVFYGVMSTPTMLLVGSDEDAVTAWRGEVPGLDELKGSFPAGG